MARQRTSHQRCTNEQQTSRSPASQRDGRSIWRARRMPALMVAAGTKTKFTCSACGQNDWGKLDLAIACIHCGLEMRTW
jgi:hypothetical protein